MAVELGSAYGRVNLDASGMRRGARQAEGALTGLQRRGGMAMTALGLSIAGAGAAVVRGIGGAVKQSSAFQSELVDLELAATDTDMTFQELHDTAIQVGADTRLLGVSATGAEQAMTGFYKSGLSTGVILGDLQGYMAGTTELTGALRSAIDLAAASELNMVQTSDLATVVLSTFGKELETDAEKVEFVDRALNNFLQSADASVAEVPSR